MKIILTALSLLLPAALAFAGPQAPKALPATDVTESSFTAHWEAVPQVSEYALNVYSFTWAESGIESTTVTESFEGLVPLSSTSKRNKYIDYTLSTLPEGWTIDVNSVGSVRQLYTTDVATDTSSVNTGKIALAFDATGDSIVTPILPAPATQFSFWLKNGNGNGSVTVYGFDGRQWETIGEISTFYYRMGNTASFSNEIPVGCIQFKIVYTDESPEMNSPTAIDDISYTYGGTVKVRDYLLEQHSVSGTSAPVSGMIADTDYYYTVQSRMGEELSEESNIIDVFGFTGTLATPVLKEFTDIKDGEYTANWNFVSGATGYVVYNVYTHVAQKDETVTVLHEDFAAFTGGSVDFPIDNDGSVDYDTMTTVPDWSATFGCWTGGMLGGINIFTPVISTTNPNGCTLTLKIYGSMGDAVDIINYYAQNGTEKKSQTLLRQGVNTLNIKFEHSSQYMYFEIYFRQRDYQKEMFLDEFTMTQTLSKGEQYSYNYDYRILEGRRVNSCTFTDLPRAWGDQFAFRMSAYAIEGNRVAQSPWTELIPVPQSSGIEEVPAMRELRVKTLPGQIVALLDEPCEICVYDMQGRLVARQSGVEGENHISLTPGVYLLQAGDSRVKIMTR